MLLYCINELVTRICTNSPTLKVTVQFSVISSFEKYISYHSSMMGRDVTGGMTLVAKTFLMTTRFLSINKFDSSFSYIRKWINQQEFAPLTKMIHPMSWQCYHSRHWNSMNCCEKSRKKKRRIPKHVPCFDMKQT